MKTEFIRAEFNRKVRLHFDAYVSEILSHDKECIIANAYDIAKMRSICDFLTESTNDELIEKVWETATNAGSTNVLNTMFEYEWNYDEPVWLSWDGLEDMCSDYVRGE